MGQRTRSGRESSGKIVTETEKAEDATLETWFVPDPFSFHTELNLFPILPDPHFCSSVAPFMHALQPGSLLHLHQTHRHPQKNPPNINLGCTLERSRGDSLK